MKSLLKHEDGTLAITDNPPTEKKRNGAPCVGGVDHFACAQMKSVGETCL